MLCISPCFSHLSLCKHYWGCLYIPGRPYFLCDNCIMTLAIPISVPTKWILVSSASMNFVKIEWYIKDLIASGVLAV
jgi:hypothetical protein